MKSSKHIIIWSEQSSTLHSGGRFHACILAKCLSIAGYTVYFITNKTPIFWFEIFCETRSTDRLVKLIIESKQNKLREIIPPIIDYSFIVPPMRNNYKKKIKQSIFFKSRIALLNFESANWYNKYSPIPRDHSKWDSWKIIASASNLILSSTKESQIYAKNFYQNISSSCTFEYCYPAINSDIVKQTKKTKKEKRILIFFTFRHDSHHKGSHLLPALIQKSMSGYTLTIITGKGIIPNSIRESIITLASLYNINLEWYSCISEKHKFELLKKTYLLLFPSYFEGYGYPPVEALLCNCHVIAFDLPVLKEVCNNHVTYAKHGDLADFKKKIGILLERPIENNLNIKNLEVASSFEGMSLSLDKILQNNLTSPPVYSTYLNFKNKIQNKKNQYIRKLVKLKEKKSTEKIAESHHVRIIYPPFENWTQAKKNLSKLKFLILPSHSNNIKTIFTISDIKLENDFKCLIQNDTDFLYTNSIKYHLKVLQNNNIIINWKKLSYYNLIKFNLLKKLLYSISIENREFETNSNITELMEISCCIERISPAEITQENKIKFINLKKKVIQENKTNGLICEDSSELYSYHIFSKEKFLKISYEDILSNSDFLYIMKPDIIFIRNYYELILASKKINELEENILQYLTTNKGNFIITDYFSSIILCKLFSNYSDNIIGIPESYDKLNLTLAESFSIPKIPFEKNYKVMPIVSSLCSKISFLKKTD